MHFLNIAVPSFLRQAPPPAALPPTGGCPEGGERVSLQSACGRCSPTVSGKQPGIGPPVFASLVPFAWISMNHCCFFLKVPPPQTLILFSLCFPITDSPGDSPLRTPAGTGLPSACAGALPPPSSPLPCFLSGLPPWRCLSSWDLRNSVTE